MAKKITITLSGDMKEHFDILKDAYTDLVDRYKKLEEEKAANGSESGDTGSYVSISFEEDLDARDAGTDEAPNAADESVKEDAVEDEFIGTLLDAISRITRMGVPVRRYTLFDMKDGMKNENATLCPFCNAGDCLLYGPGKTCLARPSKEEAKKTSCCENCVKPENVAGEPEAETETETKAETETETPKDKGEGVFLTRDFFPKADEFFGPTGLFPGVIFTGAGQGKTTAPEREKAPAEDKPKADAKPEKVEAEFDKTVEDLAQVARIVSLAAQRHAKGLSDILKNYL